MSKGQTQKQEIAFSNRYLYYYASLLRKLYGFVVRRGENVPDERYVGHIGEQPQRQDLPLDFVSPDALKPRESGEPAVGEIILFRYRKRLLLGYCQQVLPRRVSEIIVQSEDRRRLRFHHTNLVYLTGVSVEDDSALLHTYAASVRKLSIEIDLQGIWELAADSETPLSQNDIADLYWNENIDATRWVALCLHLDRACPYFTAHGTEGFVPVSESEVDSRKRAQKRRHQRQDERDEFVNWMCDTETTDTESLTKTQHMWLDAVCQFALWGQEAERATMARDLLNDICPGRKDLKRAAFDQLVAKGIWREDENLDLLRAEITTQDPEEARREAEALDVMSVLQGRKKLRQKLFVIRDPHLPELAFSFRTPLFSGPEFGIHVPDLGACIASDGAIDQTAIGRQVTVELPDLRVPMLPEEVLKKMRFPSGKPHPAISLLWRMDRKGRLKSFDIIPSRATVQTEFSANEIDRALHNASHTHHRAIRFFTALIERLQTSRTPRDPEIDPPNLQVQHDGTSLHIEPPPNDLAHRIVREIEILASVAIGRWFAQREWPAIYETRDPIENLARLNQIEHPVVRRHEIDYFTPKLRYDARPAYHHALGVAFCCPIMRPADRYADLLMQRQLIHALQHNQPRYQTEPLDLLRFYMQEAHAQAEGLYFRRRRDLILRHWANQTGREFRAVILHIKRQGVLIELLDAPFKTVVFPGQPVQVGDEITLRLTGVDTWLSRAHFTVLQAEPHIRP